jgi:hypothetical protein
VNKSNYITSRLIVLIGSIAFVLTGFSSLASADKEVDANVVVIVSDDITKRTIELGRPGDGGGGDGGEEPAAEE